MSIATPRRASFYGDKTEVVVSRLWERMQEQLKKASASLLGWYHSHPGQGGFLTAHDVETHEKFFSEPWHVAVLVAAEAGGVTGRFFRATQTNDWPKAPVAFYELLQADSIKPDGKKRSFITWRNYKAYGPTLTGPKPPKPAAPPEPKAEEPEEEAAEAEKKAAPPPKADKGFRIMRGSADDIPVIRTSEDDEPAPAPKPEPPPPPLPPPPPPPVEKRKPAEPVIVPPANERSVAPPPLGRKPVDDIPWTVTPESVASVPPPVIEPLPSASPYEPRRIPTQTFRLLEDSTAEQPKPKPKPRRRRRLPWGRWLRRVAVLLLIAGVGAGGYWYYVLRTPRPPPPWAGLVDRVKKLVARATAPPPAPSRRPPRAPPPAPAAGTSPVRAAPPPPAPIPQPLAPPSPFARFDRLTDSLARAVRNYRDRAQLFASGRIDCGGLANGLVAIESLWPSYNAERRARMANFDQRRALQDQGTYASVDSVESSFEQSGCRRP